MSQSQAHELQLSRLENKYIIPQDTALVVRDFVASYLEIDEFGATRPDLSYPVHSLYLDSDDLSIYWSTINGNKNRYKLRLRFYENRPNAPVYFEIKRRMNNAILKQRGAVRREAVREVLAGMLPGPDQMASADPRQLAAVQRFVELATTVRAAPKAHIAYQREAWVQPDDNSVRVTMDRNVLCAVDTTTDLKTEMHNPFCVFGNQVILELKFTGRFPDWFAELVRTFNLHQGAAAKYADGVALMGESLFSSHGALAPHMECARNRQGRINELRRRCDAPLIYRESASHV
ncbi:VTC domain-containing protein [bacterium]|nr:VTC domain-containing protein [bacterium]